MIECCVGRARCLMLVSHTDEVLAQLLRGHGALLRHDGLVVHGHQDGLGCLHDVDTAETQATLDEDHKAGTDSTDLVPFFPLITRSDADRNMNLEK